MIAYARGDRRAFDRLFAILSPRVHGLFMRMFRDAAVADDMLQITFLKVHRARAEYREGSRVRPWVLSIAARVGIDELRKRKRSLEEGDEDKLGRADAAAAVARARTDLLEQAQIAERVRAAIDELPDGQRVVVHLHRYEELTFAEIAKVLGSTEGAVKLRAFRAYEQLRKRLQPLLSGEKAA